MSRNRIIVNSISFDVEGENVSIRNGTLYVSGASVASGLNGTVHIIWEGELASLETDASVECQNVYGNVTAGHSVHCKSVPGKFANKQPTNSHGHNGNISAGHSVWIG